MCDTQAVPAEAVGRSPPDHDLSPTTLLTRAIYGVLEGSVTVGLAPEPRHLVIDRRGDLQYPGHIGLHAEAGVEHDEDSDTIVVFDSDTEAPLTVEGRGRKKKKSGHTTNAKTSPAWDGRSPVSSYVRYPCPSKKNWHMAERDDPGPPVVPGGQEICLGSRNLRPRC